MPRYEQDDMAIGYCRECGREATEEPQDFGIGSYEFWGAPGVHEDWHLVSPCCEAEVVDSIEMTEPFEHYFEGGEGMSEEEAAAKVEANNAEEDELARQRQAERGEAKPRPYNPHTHSSHGVPRTDIEEARDLSGQGGNSTSALQAHYEELMSIQDPEELMQRALEIVEPLVGRGVSERNWAKFQNMINSAAQRGLTGLQFMLSNYILSGSGLSVDQGGRFGESTEVSQIADIITEDAGIFNELAPHQQYLKHLIESCTSFRVYVVS